MIVWGELMRYLQLHLFACWSRSWTIMWWVIITTTVVVLLTVILIVIINYNHSQVQMNCRRFAKWRFGSRAKRNGQNASAMPRTCQIGNWLLVAKHHQCNDRGQLHKTTNFNPPTPSMKAIGDQTSCRKPSQKKKSIGGWDCLLTQFKFGAMGPRRDRRRFEESMEIQRRRFHVEYY